MNKSHISIITPNRFMVVIFFLALFLSGCKAFELDFPWDDSTRLTKSLGEQSSAYGYVPLDGLSVQSVSGENCATGSTEASANNYLPLVRQLPDLSVRFSVGTFQPDGSLTFGPAKVTVKYQAYRAVLDYVNVDAVPQNFFVRVFINQKDLNGKQAPHQFPYKLKFNEEIDHYEAKLVPSASTTNKGNKQGSGRSGFYFSSDDYDEAEQGASKAPQFDYSKYPAREGWSSVTIPVYVGIGMRLTADVRALSDGVTLSSLGSIGAAAQTSSLTGTLSVQTLGINGKDIATTLPMPSKLDQTTVENAILALGSTRAMIYTTSENDGGAIATPRVVGLYSPIGNDPALINVVYSQLSNGVARLIRPCVVEAQKVAAQQRSSSH